MTAVTPWVQLTEWVKTMSGGLPVMRQHPNAPAPTPPYITLDAIGRRETGTVANPYASSLDDEADTWQRKGFFMQSFTLRVQVYGEKADPYQALDVAERIQRACKNDELQTDILQPNIAMMSVLAPPTDVTGLLGDQWQARAFIDLLMEVCVPYAYSKARFDKDISVIERVLASGTLEGATSPPTSVMIDSDDA